jgi:hypothetical protein
MVALLISTFYVFAQNPETKAQDPRHAPASTYACHTPSTPLVIERLLPTGDGEGKESVKVFIDRICTQVAKEQKIDPPTAASRQAPVIPHQPLVSAKTDPDRELQSWFHESFKEEDFDYRTRLRPLVGDLFEPIKRDKPEPTSHEPVFRYLREQTSEGPLHRALFISRDIDIERAETDFGNYREWWALGTERLVQIDPRTGSPTTRVSNARAEGAEIDLDRHRTVGWGCSENACTLFDERGNVIYEDSSVGFHVFFEVRF